MKWLERRSEYAKNIHIVTLAGDEVDMPDADLIYLADNHGDHDELTAYKERGGHPGHFGGRVMRKDHDRHIAEIWVYID